jgi:SNF2 family DNA or RNA helicase
MNNNTPIHWFKPLLDIKSLGQTTKKARALHELHEARLIHNGQFFTPVKISKWIWEQITPYLEPKDEESKTHIADNCVGTGRLLYFANPAKHTLHFSDIDENNCELLTQTAQEAGFTVESDCISMENLKMRNMDAAIINPPFSLKFEGPQLEKFETNHFGVYGPKTTATSQTYALEQALKGADIVVAIVPSTEVDRIRELYHISTRLKAVAHLSSKAFLQEGANVKTSIMFFDRAPEKEPVFFKIETFEETLPVTLRKPNTKKEKPIFSDISTSNEKPSILTPVTGDNNVRVYRSGRHIKLKFKCGLTEARVMNQILNRKIDYKDRSNEEFGEGRMPSNIHYIGQGRLLLDLYMAQENPLEELNHLNRIIIDNGGNAVIEQQLTRYIIKHHKKLIKQKEGFSRWVQKNKSSQVFQNKNTVKVQSDYLMEPDKWGGLIAFKGEEINLVNMSDSEVTIGFKDQLFAHPKEYFLEHCMEVKDLPKEEKWIRIGSSIQERYPNEAIQTRKHLEKLGIDKWTWDWQQHDIIECMLAPLGVLASWDMGLGKTRLSFACCLMHTAKHNLIVVPAHLVDQFEEEALEIGLEINIIRKPKDLQNLKKINVISISRIRTTFDRNKPNVSYGKHMRRWFGLVIVDEGHCLRHHSTAQSRAVRDLSPRKRIVLSGTPISNYPRDIWPVANWAIRGGHIAQPYDLYELYPEKKGFHDTRYLRRGIDVFKNKFVSLEWSTHHFNEDMEQGAKREIPRIKNLEAYRNYNQSFILRRNRYEPDVKPYIKFPKATEIDHTIEWDREHLAYYLKVADEFKGWFTKAMEESKLKGTNLSMIATLARIGAVEAACNHPHHPTKNCPLYSGPMTSKETAIIDRALEIAESGAKTIIFVQSPKSAQRFCDKLNETGQNAMAIHGQVNQKDRTKIIKDQFRNGDLPILVATYGVAQTGLNLPEASHVLLACRQWTATVERQAIARVLRPQQKNKVIVERFHIDGSIDMYQAQMVEFKSDAADSGLDFADPETNAREFLHIDHILEDFVKHIKELQGLERKQLKSA